MPDPIPFIRPNSKVNPVPTRYREPQTAAERQSDQLAMLREVSEIGMSMACRVAKQILRGAPVTGRSPDLRRSFIQVTREVRRTIALRARIARDGSRDPWATAQTNPTRTALRDYLYRLANTEEEPNSRARLLRCIDAELRDDPA